MSLEILSCDLKGGSILAEFLSLKIDNRFERSAIPLYLSREIKSASPPKCGFQPVRRILARGADMYKQQKGLEPRESSCLPYLSAT